jgi:hypothetical protein
MEIQELLTAMQEGLDRMAAATALLERSAELMGQSGEGQKIVATADNSREQELMLQLQAAERQIAELRASASQLTDRAAHARKTLPPATTQLLAKQGISTLDSVEAGALDAALTGLSLEQRIAVKAQLLRAGVLS